jgi:hypothetical protein
VNSYWYDIVGEEGGVWPIVLVRRGHFGFYVAVRLGPLVFRVTSLPPDVRFQASVTRMDRVPAMFGDTPAPGFAWRDRWVRKFRIGKGFKP